MSAKSRAKKIKVVDVKTVGDEPTTYDEIIKEVNEPPPIEETAQIIEYVEPPNAKKMSTCEGCGKSMTDKNLKYSHRKTCPANQPKTVLMEVEVEDDESPPAPPKLERQITYHEPTEIPKPRKPRQKKEVKPSDEPVRVEPSRAVKMAERYQALAMKALP
jgi:hypothetical protein